MLELKQEIVSIAVLLIVCITLSISCLILWMVRCRRDQIRNREDKNDHQRELDNFEESVSLFYALYGIFQSQKDQGSANTRGGEEDPRREERHPEEGGNGRGEREKRREKEESDWDGS